MFFTSCHGRFVFTTTDGWKNNPHGCFKTSVWGNVRQGILYLVMGTDVIVVVQTVVGTDVIVTVQTVVGTDVDT